MPDRAITQREIERLKRRRDALLSRACNRHERPEIIEEVRRINRRIAGLDAGLQQGDARRR